MPPRSNWKGFLRLSLVSVPVQAINSEISGGEVHLNQLHAACHSRIRYQKICPIHGEVSNDEIVSGYQYAKDQYVVVDPEELNGLRSETNRAIEITTFTSPDQVDPIYFDGRTYYLLPDGPVGRQPYAVLRQAMADSGKWAIGQAVFFGREQLVVVRPHEQLLTMSMLKYSDQIRLQESVVDEDEPSPSKQELRLANTLIEASSTNRLDLSKYDDEYTKQLTTLIEAKVEGREIVAAPADEPPPVINLMEALKRSVDRAKGSKSTHRAPPKKLAATRRKKVSALKRKSS